MSEHGTTGTMDEQPALCEQSYYASPGDFPGDGIECYRDVDGRYGLFIEADDDRPAATMWLCEDHAEFWRERPDYEEVKRIAEP